MSDIVPKATGGQPRPSRDAAAQPHPVMVTAMLLVVVASLSLALPGDSALAQAMRWLTAITGCGAGLVALGLRPPSAPAQPRRTIVKLPVPAEPSGQIIDLAHNCRRCGKPMTVQLSMERGVGPDCYRQYGPRQRFTSNPAHQAWGRKVDRLRVEEVSQQAAADRSHAAAMELWKVAHSRWEALLSSPAQVERGRNASKAKAVSASGWALWLVAVLL